MQKRAYGISLGASTIGAVEMTEDGGRKVISRVMLKPHEGNPRDVLTQVLDELDCGDAPILVTGRKFREHTQLPSVTEPEATEEALQHIGGETGDVDTVISAGGETFLVYILDDKRRIVGMSSGNKCASGTGEFFLQQVKRMNLGAEEAVELAARGDPYTLSGRCSVFCKSDCTHALNKGEPIPNVAAGLCRMIAAKMDELLASVPHKHVLVVGGTAQNKTVVKYLREKLSSRNGGVKLTIPREAPYFEALGAARLAYKKGMPRPAELFKPEHSSFNFLDPLTQFADLVTFKDIVYDTLRTGDRCVVGVDVGSTTTKAVLLRTSDDALIASEYLRTDGNPVEATRVCLRSLLEKVGRDDLEVEGIGVTGSGRRIAGLYCLTDGVINEIIAHAAAAAHFDKEVDTIFEIGGQDAKYTHLTAGVASDYAMNEACSAGTGSFLEESAFESLGVSTKEIAPLALRARRPPNFSDQCAAFISSDIKNATHEGIDQEEILAGLVYSVCLNYVNRVKGNRPVGKKLFMQGGVCYNKAVPLAMAAILRQPIIVPPEPGLMGALGVALEIKRRMDLGLLAPTTFGLAKIIDRTVTYEKPFDCRGGREKCDLACSVNRLRIDGKIYPFGGACNKYSDVHSVDESAEGVGGLDLVRDLNEMLFERFIDKRDPLVKGPTVGLSTSFLAGRLYPLYHTFFTRLGCTIVTPDRVHEEAFHRQVTSMCFPAQLAMGLYEDLLDKRPGVIFMPHLQEMHVEGGIDRKGFCATCLLVQGEPFWLRQAFRDRSDEVTLLTPTLNFQEGLEAGRAAFLEVGDTLGFDRARVQEAFEAAVDAQRRCDQAIKARGREVLEELHKDPSALGLVLFGRVYNAYSPLANKGIPRKLISRGQLVIPFDMLSVDDVALGPDHEESMHWEAGQRILKAAQKVAGDPQLFGVYIINFLCAPDSFIVSYFRRVMKQKPSLTLELDEHTADAGVNTRIEAFLDIVHNYLDLGNDTVKTAGGFLPAAVIHEDGMPLFVDSRGDKCALGDPRVTLVLPSMGQLTAQAVAAATEHFGIRTLALPEANRDALRLGRAATTGKECLPMHVCLGSLLQYVRDKRRPGDKIVMFLPRAGGYCRLGQYHVLAGQIIREKRISDVALITPEMEDNFLALGPKWGLATFRALMVSDLMADIQSALWALARDQEQAAHFFERQWKEMVDALRLGDRRLFNRRLRETGRALKSIPVTIPYKQAPQIEVTGEIFVRRDAFSNLGIVERLARKGFIVKVAPITEWVFYVNHLIRNKYVESNVTLMGRLSFLLTRISMRLIERRIKRALASSGLCEADRTDIEGMMRHKRHVVPDCVSGEHDLVVGMTLRDSLSKYCGVVSVGPFGCMQLRFAEALTAPQADVRGKKEALRQAGRPSSLPEFDDCDRFPFLSVETDGNPYPQLLEARLESFCLQAARIGRKQGKRTDALVLS